RDHLHDGHRDAVRDDRGRDDVEASAAILSVRRGGESRMIRQILGNISLWAIPVLLVFIPLVGIARNIKVYDVFIEGAKEGFQVAIRIIPFLVGILVAIGMFRGSGAMDLLTAGLRPLLAATRF